MNGTYIYDPYAAQSYAITLLVNVSRTVFGFLAMTGNGFILYTIARHPSVRRNLCNLLIGILAMADFWTGAGLFFCSSMTLGFQLTEWHKYTKLHCNLLQYLPLSGVQMSQIATIFIALDRLKAVQHPMLYAAQNRTQRFSLALSVTVIYSLIASAFIFVGINYSERPEICQGGSTLNFYFRLYWQLFSVVVALIVFVCYIRTAHTLTRNLKNVHSGLFNHELEKQRVVFKAITIVLVVYGLCWCLPNFIIVAATIFGVNTALLGKLTPLIAIGTGIYSSSNVVVYALKHKELGAAMRKTFSKITTSADQSIELIKNNDKETSSK